MKEVLFHKNLSIWSHTHPREAIWLQYVDADHLKLIKCASGYENLKEKSNSTSFYYHAEDNPLKEAQERFKKVVHDEASLVFHYGVGLGYDFEAAKEWLQNNSERKIVFLEDDLAVIARLFETEMGTALLNHPQVFLYFFKDLDESSGLFNELFWHFYAYKHTVACSSANERKKREQFFFLSEKLTDLFETKRELLDEYLHYGATFYRNFYVNLFELSKAYLGNAFFGKFPQIPAVICGAGPSLQKNGFLLNKLRNRALIFAGSSSLNALEAMNISPHFGVGIDPNPKQADRLRELTHSNFPFFYRNRIFPRALHSVKGPKLYVTGSGGYDVSDWIEKELKIPSHLSQGEELEEGHNVVNFALSLATAMGCNPIILVGMDLAYTGMKLYSPGVISSSNQLEKESVVLKEIENTALLKQDIYGQPIYTLWKWVLESRWISAFVKNHPDIVLVNATEGGLGFEGIPNFSLEDASKKYLQKRYRVSFRIEKQLDKAKMHGVTDKAIKGVAEKLEASLKRCIEGLKILSEENRLLKSKILKGEEILKDLYQTPRASLVETDLAEEEAFQAVLQVFNEVYSRVLEKEIKSLSKAELKDRERMLKRLDLNEKKYAFLSKTARVNLEFLQLASRY